MQQWLEAEMAMTMMAWVGRSSGDGGSGREWRWLGKVAAAMAASLGRALTTAIGPCRAVVTTMMTRGGGGTGREERPR
ncbi:hypothetical protein GUJ93_ZPchr0012g18888 [Zizania palustris]|uniref:Uncharacterized protein n=1 Tax=Zizania palustris TaxID=103762 RepID=A0A8J5WU93_ZIZPA|nr:hypothetical protein GUJ93_ZPchr0012g18888 [Zizania palustris]